MAREFPLNDQTNPHLLFVSSRVIIQNGESSKLGYLPSNMATWEIPELNSDFNGKVNCKRESLFKFIAMFDYQRVNIISFEFLLTNGHGSKGRPHLTIRSVHGA